VSCQMAIYDPSTCMMPGYPYHCPGAPSACQCFGAPLACDSITQACPAPNTCVACNTCGRTYNCSLPQNIACE
jgi:hypothetical protein